MKEDKLIGEGIELCKDIEKTVEEMRNGIAKGLKKLMLDKRKRS